MDALSEVRRLAIPLTRTSLNQIVECHRVLLAAGSGEIVAALRAIRLHIERVASLLGLPHFTNDARMIASMQSAVARDLSALALEKFSIKNIKKIES